MKYVIGEEFDISKTSDKFISVTFTYGDYVWDGVLPLLGEKQGYEISVEEVKEKIEDSYNKLEPSKRVLWKDEAKKKWKKHTTQTYKVFEALFSGEWECKVCGPVAKVNPQSSARIKDIKTQGFFVATKTKHCDNCSKKTFHDILIMTDITKDQQKIQFRNPISKKLDLRICTLLNRKECVFERIKTRAGLVIDHKFPSQRWTKKESNNSDEMSDSEIKKKFQLLDNQTNLLKSRECDRCKFEKKRGIFMGIRWYYKGNENWAGSSIDDESGCEGCPWYDILEWKSKLKESLGI